MNRDEGVYMLSKAWNAMLSQEGQSHWGAPTQWTPSHHNIIMVGIQREAAIYTVSHSAEDDC